MKNKKMTPRIRFKGFTDAWEQRKLSELGSITTGNTPSTKNSENYTENGMIWVTPTDIVSNVTNHSKKNLSEKGSESARIVPSGSLLITSIASIGKNTIMGKCGAFNQQINALIPNSRNDSYFLFSQSHLWSKKMNSIASSGTMKIINKSEFSTIITKVPNLCEQKNIGKLLNKIDHLITFNERKHEQLTLLKKLFLQRLFNNSWHFKGLSNPWEQRKLSDVIDFINGKAFNQRELLNNGKYKVLRVGNFYTNNEWYYSNLELPDKNYINKGDLIYTWSATFGPHIWNGKKVIYHYHIWKLVLSNEIDKQFLYYFLEQDKDDLMSNTNGSTMIHLTKYNMENKTIFIPPLDEQKYIGKLLNKIDDSIKFNDKKLNRLNQLKKFLMQNMFI